MRLMRGSNLGSQDYKACVLTTRLRVTNHTEGRWQIYYHASAYFLFVVTQHYQSYEFHNSRNNCRCEII